MIKENLNEIRKGIPEGVELACVSKFHPVEAIEEAYAAGAKQLASQVAELNKIYGNMLNALS